MTKVLNGRTVNKVGGVVWYKDGLLHRTDGPAVEYPNGSKEWWVNGVKLSEKEFMEKTMSDEKVVKPATKKQVNQTAVRNAVTIALQGVLKKNEQLNAIREENKALKAELSTLKKEFHDQISKIREKESSLCPALSKQSPQEYFMTIGCHDQAMALDAMANCHGLYMFCLERVDSGKGLESEFRVGFKTQSGNTTPAESMRNFIASFKEVK